MKIIVLSGAVALMLAGCGSDHRPVPEHGTVTDAGHNEAWVQQMPGTMSCSGQPPVCITIPGVPIFWPEEWNLTITDFNNPDWVGTVGVDQSVYDKCKLHTTWPECSR